MSAVERKLLDDVVAEFRIRHKLPLREKKQMHMHVHGQKQVDHNGMRLWRPPTAVESLINLKAIEDAFDSSEEQLKKSIEALKNKLIADAVAGVILLDPVDYHTLTVEPDEKELAKYRDELQAIYDKGTGLVVDELTLQGATDVYSDFDIDSEDDQTLDNLATITGSKLANDVQSRVAGIALTLVALGIAGSLLKDRIFEAFSKLSEAYVGAAAATASHVALNTGRDATGAHNAGIIKEVYYSSVLDQNTCIPCQDADGETAESETDLPDAPNPDCEGWGRCRCIHVFVYEGEQKGGAGSGNFGHAGRQGQVGGSVASGAPVYAQVGRAVSAFGGKPKDVALAKPVQIISEHLFHGTTEEAWKLIQKSGLDPKADGQWILSNDTPERAASVYMTNDKDMAVYFGSFAARKLAQAQGQHHNLVTPVILEIKVPKEFQDKIVLDDQVESSVMFKGKIPPEWITRVPFNVAEPVNGKDDSKTIWAVLLVDGNPEAKFNPNHAPAGSSAGGQFTSGSGGVQRPQIIKPAKPKVPVAHLHVRELLHATPAKNIDSIMKDGLVTEKNGIETTTGREAKVYLTTNPFMADNVGMVSSIMHDDGKFAVFSVKPKKLTVTIDPESAHDYPVRSNQMSVISKRAIKPEEISGVRKYEVLPEVLADVKRDAGDLSNWRDVMNTLGDIRDALDPFQNSPTGEGVVFREVKATDQAEPNAEYGFVTGDEGITALEEFMAQGQKFNPNHAPAGSSAGGQFTSGDGGAIKPHVVTTPPTPEPVGGPSLIVYHGTKDDLLKSIKEKGLIPGGGGLTVRTSESRYYVGDRAQQVFMSTDKNEAMQYAEHTAWVHNEYYEQQVHPLLLKIAIPKAFQDKIIKDESAPSIIRLDTTVPPEWITPMNAESKADESVVYAVIMYDGEAKGGEGSGNYGHAGRPGLVGGSADDGMSGPSEQEKFDSLKAKWSNLNDKLFDLVDDPNSPEFKSLVEQQKQVVKDIYMLKLDKGDIAGIGLPGGPRDVVIVGAGPGGLSAAINGGSEGLDTLLIDANTVAGGQAKFSSRIENFGGFVAGIKGNKLAQNLFEQAQRTKAETMLGTRVTGLEYDPKTGLKTVLLDNGQKLDTRSVILAGGVEFQKMNFPGADSKSVFYADAKKLADASVNKPVVVIGGSNGAAQAALGAAKTASFVTVLARSPIAKGMSDYQVSALRVNPKIHVIEGDEVAKLILGTDGLAKQLVTKGGKTIDASAVGIFVGGQSNTKWLPPSININHGKVVADSNYQTSMPGVFVVGDIKEGAGGRVGAAYGEGQIAVKNLFGYFKGLGYTGGKSIAPEIKSQRLGQQPRSPDVLKLIDDVFAQDLENPYVGQMIEPDYFPESGTEAKGGSGSGNFGHAGRPGLIGGSGGGLGRFFDNHHPHVLLTTPTGQELDVPSINWTEVGKLYLKALPLIESLAEQVDLTDVYHLALEQVFEVISSPAGEAAMSMIPSLFKSNPTAQSLVEDLRKAVGTKDGAKARVAADQLLALCYEVQHVLQDETQRATVNAAVTAMEGLVTKLGDDPAKVKDIWMKERK